MKVKKQQEEGYKNLPIKNNERKSKTPIKPSLKSMLDISSQSSPSFVNPELNGLSIDNLK